MAALVEASAKRVRLVSVAPCPMAINARAEMANSVKATPFKLWALTFVIKGWAVCLESR